MKKKRRIKVVLKRKLETHPSLRYQWDPKQSDPMHPLNEIRARELDCIRVLQYRLNLSIDDMKKEGTLAQLNALVYTLQGMETMVGYGLSIKERGKVKL